MPFVDTNDGVSLGEKSFATWHEALDHYQTLPYARILPGHGAPGGKELFAQMRECMTAAKEEYKRMTQLKVSFSECVQQVPSTEMFSFIASPCSRSLRTSAGISRRLKTRGIDESIDLSRDR